MTVFHRLAATVLLSLAAAHGQVARLALNDAVAGAVDAGPGDTLQIDLRADLGRYQASGITVYLQIPADGFRLVDDATGAGPFIPGGLFGGGVVVRNEELVDGLQDLAPGQRLLEFTTLLGPASERGRSGSGLVACLRVVCERAVTGDFRVHHSPLHESRIVLADGRTEMPLLTAPAMQVRVDLGTGVGALPWARLKLQSRYPPARD